MALAKRTIVDQIEVRRDGAVQVRLAKQIVDGEQVALSEWHRAAFEPGVDLEAGMKIVNNDLIQMGEEPVSGSEVERIRRIMSVEHTPETVAEFNKAREERERAVVESVSPSPERQDTKPNQRRKAL